MKNEINVPMSRIADNLYVTVKVTGVRTFTVRWWVTFRLLQLASLLAPAKEFTIEVNE